jgi:hypothetical protein
MRVVLDPTAFSQPLDLLALLAACARAQHGLAAPIAARDGWLDTLGALAGPLGALFDALAARYTLHPATAATITVRCAGGSNWPTAALEPGDAAALLAQPLELLVENERADFAFLRRIAHPHQRAQLDAAIAAGALRVRQGGGINEVQKTVEALQSVAKDSNAADRRLRRLRTVVLYDRDAQATDHTQPGQTAKTLDRLLSAPAGNDPWPMWGHRLRRRHIESYVPTELLAEWLDPGQTRATAPPATGIVSKNQEQHKAVARAIVALRRASAEKRRLTYSLPIKRGLLPLAPKPDQGEGPVVGQHATAAGRAAVEQAVDALLRGRWPPPFNQLTSAQRADLLVGWKSGLADAFRDAASSWDQCFWDEFDRDLDPTDPGDLSALALVDNLLERL